MKLSEPINIKFPTKYSEILQRVHDINPVNYFKNKKKCQEWADNADTVARGKTRYKDCMDDPSDY